MAHERVLRVLVLSTFFLLTSPVQSQDDLDNGDVNFERIYPTVLLVMLARNAAHSLPYTLGCLEEQHYPKERLHWYIRSDHNLDNTADLIKAWIENVEPLYGSIDFKTETTPVAYPDEIGPLDWSDARFAHIMALKEEALQTARQQNFDRVLFIDTDQFLLDPYTLVSLSSSQNESVIVAPMLIDVASTYSNYWGDVTPTGYYRSSDYYHQILDHNVIGCHPVPMVHSAFMIDLTQDASLQLTYDVGLMTSPMYAGPLDDMLVFAESVRRANVSACVRNDRHFGYLLAPPSGDDDDIHELRNAMRHLLSELVSLNGLPGLLHSSFLSQRFPPRRTFGFDQVYVINLERRPDRLAKMDFVMRMLGLDYKAIKAIDGASLTVEELRSRGVRQLPEFLDPHGQRPMTMGEVGCFLSHYSIWKDMRDRGLKRVLIFEDDIRLDVRFEEVLKAIMADINRIELNWDLVFLARKSLRKDLDKVRGHRFLAHVGYSYWLLAYALSLSGAEKLLNAEPLTKMLPTDEYLPIMYNAHPEKSWQAAFPHRNLRAFTADPLIVQPAVYTGQPKHVSDTETSTLLPEEFR